MPIYCTKNDLLNCFSTSPGWLLTNRSQSEIQLEVPGSYKLKIVKFTSVKQSLRGKEKYVKIVWSCFHIWLAIGVMHSCICVCGGSAVVSICSTITEGASYSTYPLFWKLFPMIFTYVSIIISTTMLYTVFYFIYTTENMLQILVKSIKLCYDDMMFKAQFSLLILRVQPLFKCFSCRYLHYLILYIIVLFYYYNWIVSIIVEKYYANKYSIFLDFLISTIKVLLVINHRSVITSRNRRKVTYKYM